jgi:hypothetical protein
MNDDVARLLSSMSGVGQTSAAGRSEWRYRGRLVARQPDDVHLVIRAEFGARDTLVRQHPETFSIPSRFEKHMMIVADVVKGDVTAIEDALVAALALQRRRD